MQKALCLAKDIKGLPPDSEETEDLEYALDALCDAGAELNPSQAIDVAILLLEHGDADMGEVRQRCSLLVSVNCDQRF